MSNWQFFAHQMWSKHYCIAFISLRQTSFHPHACFFFFHLFSPWLLHPAAGHQHEREPPTVQTDLWLPRLTEAGESWRGWSITINTNAAVQPFDLLGCRVRRSYIACTGLTLFLITRLVFISVLSRFFLCFPSQHDCFYTAAPSAPLGDCMCVQDPKHRMINGERMGLSFREGWK